MSAVTEPVLRAFRPEDVAAVYEICRRTGAEGSDATGRYSDPDLLGHLWAGPFLALEPEHAVVLEADSGVVGYCLATASTRGFEDLCEREWWPALRERYADPAGDPAGWSPDQRLAHLVHHPPRSPDEVVAGHPAQLHVDLLPRAQGRGLGRRIVTRVCELVAGAGAAGVHLGVGPGNTAAQGFYRRLGFTELGRTPQVVWMGHPLR